METKRKKEEEITRKQMILEKERDKKKQQQEANERVDRNRSEQRYENDQKRFKTTAELLERITLKLEQVPNTLSIKNNSDSSKSEVDISNITCGTEESQLVIVSPGARKGSSLIQNHKIPKEPPKKRSRSREKSGSEFSRYTKISGVDSETTTPTTGSNSLASQHDSENGSESQQNHDHQSGTLGLTH